MAKVTLLFNNKPIDVLHLEQETSTVGPDSSNTFTIDSLAIAPTQLQITHIENGCFIESLSEQFPTIINEKQTARQTLNHGNTVHVGKHTLLYSNTATLDSTYTDSHNTIDKAQETAAEKPVCGNLQVINGADIGLVIALNNAITELNIHNNVPAIIAKRHNGYFISHLDDDVSILIDGNPISSETKLENNVNLNVENLNYLFFLE
jgi:hypothetical protein